MVGRYLPPFGVARSEDRAAAERYSYSRLHTHKGVLASSGSNNNTHTYDLDDAVIHFRCGDIMEMDASRGPLNSGFVPLSVLLRYLRPLAPRSVGIVTTPLVEKCSSKLETRAMDCKHGKQCHDILEVLLPALQSGLTGPRVESMTRTRRWGRCRASPSLNSPSAHLAPFVYGRLLGQWRGCSLALGVGTVLHLSQASGPPLHLEKGICMCTHSTVQTPVYCQSSASKRHKCRHSKLDNSWLSTSSMLLTRWRWLYPAPGSIVRSACASF